jgi:undecaprenyl-diphosphatase
MPLALVVLLGIVEGLTEYLPVSSTGHLVLVGHFLGLPDDDGNKAFDIVIQLGALLAVVVHYRSLLAAHVRGLFRREAESVRLLGALLLAFAPAAVAGLFLRKVIHNHLLSPKPVAVALVVGGVAMVVIERLLRRRSVAAETGLGAVTARRAIAIGLAQCLSLLPGTSRAMCTIVAGQVTGLSTSTAAEFSFLLALPTLGAATVYEGIKERHGLFAKIGTVGVGVGLVVSFFVAWGVIATFLAYLKRRGLEPFGWYRIALGLVVLWALARA